MLVLSYCLLAFASFASEALNAQAPVTFSGAVHHYDPGTNMAALAIDWTGRPWTADSSLNWEIPVVGDAMSPSAGLHLPLTQPHAFAFAPNGNVYLFGGGSNTLQLFVAISNYAEYSLGIFTNISAMTVDKAGNLYVADAGARTITEFFATGGVVTPSSQTRTWRNTAGIVSIADVAVDGDGNIFFTDPDSKNVKELPATAGSVPANQQAVARGSGFTRPWSVTTDPAGNLYVTDLIGTGKGALVWKVAVAGGSYNSTTIFAQGFADHGFSSPTAIRCDGNHTLYVADTQRGIEAFDLSSPVDFGSREVTLSPGSNQLTLQFTYYGDIVRGAGGITITDSSGSGGQDFFDLQTGSCKSMANQFNGYVCSIDVMFKPQKIGTRKANLQILDHSGAAYVTVPLTGMATWHYSELSLALDHPYGLALDPSNTLYVGDTLNRRIVDQDGDPLNACGTPAVYGNFAVDRLGTVYFGDVLGSRVRSCSSAGVLRDVATNVMAPRAVALDGSGNLFVAAADAIKKIVLTSGQMSDVLTLLSATGIALDGKQNLYVASLGGVVRRYPPFGTGYSLDTATTLASGVTVSPYGLSVDQGGDVFIADPGSSTVKIVRASDSKVFSIGGGNGVGGSTNEPTFKMPHAVVVGTDNIVYVADTGNSKVYSFPDDLFINP